MIIEVNPVHPQPRRIAQAADVLRRGGLVAYPTDTVYAVGCLLGCAQAVEKLRRLKVRARNGRAQDAHLSIIVPNLSSISDLAVVGDAAYRLLRRVTPGPYTFILPATRRVPRKMIAKRQKTIGIRIPDSAVALALVRQLGEPIATTSAKGMDGDLLDDPRAVKSACGMDVEIVLDSGPIFPQPSTILDLSEDAPVVIREGKGDLLPLGL